MEGARKGEIAGGVSLIKKFDEAKKKIEQSEQAMADARSEIEEMREEMKRRGEVLRVSETKFESLTPW